MTFDQNDV